MECSAGPGRRPVSCRWQVNTGDGWALPRNLVDVAKPASRRGVRHQPKPECRALAEVRHRARVSRGGSLFTCDLGEELAGGPGSVRPRIWRWASGYCAHDVLARARGKPDRFPGRRRGGRRAARAVLGRSAGLAGCEPRQLWRVDRGCRNPFEIDFRFGRTDRSPPGTGCTWTSSPSTATSRPSSTGCSPLARDRSTSARGTRAGTSWPIQRATSSACAVPDAARRKLSRV